MMCIWCVWQAAKAKRKEKEVTSKEDQKAKRARIDVKKDTVSGSPLHALQGVQPHGVVNRMNIHRALWMRL